MSTKRRFDSWNIIDNGLARNSTGHHLWETKSLVAELVRCGEKVRVFTYGRTPPAAEHFPGAEIVPAFTLSVYSNVSADPHWSTIENFVVHNRMLHNDLRAYSASMFENSMILAPTVGQNQLLGLSRWFGSLPEGTDAKMAICLHPPLEWTAGDPATRLYASVWKGCPAAVKNGIGVFSRIKPAAEMFAQHFGINSDVLPFVLPDALLAGPSEGAPAKGDPMTVSFLGGARLERGSSFVPDAVRASAKLGVRFYVQVRREDVDYDTKPLRALSEFPNVRVLEGMLEQDAYFHLVANSVVLLPYDPRRYRWRDSGMYHEAKLLGAPVLVTAGTWMADDVRSSGNGLVIEAFSASAIADGIARARRELPALKEGALRAAREAREQHGAKRYIEAVERAFGRHAIGSRASVQADVTAAR